MAITSQSRESKRAAKFGAAIGCRIAGLAPGSLEEF
jgi:hypothetical protein